MRIEGGKRYVHRFHKFLGPRGGFDSQRIVACFLETYGELHKLRRTDAACAAFQSMRCVAYVFVAARCEPIGNCLY